MRLHSRWPIELSIDFAFSSEIDHLSGSLQRRAWNVWILMLRDKRMKPF